MIHTAAVFTGINLADLSSFRIDMKQAVAGDNDNSFITNIRDIVDETPCSILPLSNALEIQLKYTYSVIHTDPKFIINETDAFCMVF